jgi:apolipoprotein N-acyltransferase
MRWESLLALVLAVIGGLVWALCFGVQGTLLAPWVALVPLVLLLRCRRPFLHGLVYGVSYWLVSMVWIIGTLETFGGLARPVAIGSHVLLSLYLGLYFAIFALVGAILWKRAPQTVLWSLPALWVALETIRAWMISGFPWNIAAYAWTEVPGVLELSAFVGAYGLSALAVAVNVAVAQIICRRQTVSSISVVAGAFVLLTTALLLAPGTGNADGSEKVSTGAVRIIQPNTPILQEWDGDRVLEGYRKLVRLSHEACEPGALIVWPESAAWPFLLDRDPGLGSDIERLNERGCSLILNSISSDDDHQYNSAFLLEPDGRRDRYDKAHLVPFGEYVPFGNVLPLVRRLARAAGDFSPGEGGRLLHWNDEKLGLAICFEIVFGGEVAERVRQGATVLVTITNDGWYGDTAAPWQHFRAARFRAAENRRPVIRAALTGVSAFISPRGKIEQILGVGEEGILEASLAGRRDLTFYSRFPWLVPSGCWILFAFAILRLVFRTGDKAREQARGG